MVLISRKASIPKEVPTTYTLRSNGRAMRLNVTKLQTNEALFERSALIRQMLDGNRKDINEECGYPPDIGLTGYKEMFEREGIATRVVELYPDECWAQYPEVFEDEDPQKETAFEKKWNELLITHDLFHYLHRIDVLSGIGQYGVLLLGFNGDLKDPVPGYDEDGQPNGEVDPDQALSYIRPFDQESVKIQTWETREDSPRCGYPLTYSIKLSKLDEQSIGMGTSISSIGDDTPPNTVDKIVHWTRVVHIADNRTTSEIFGTPRQRPVWNRLYDIRKILSGSAEMFWKGAFPGYSFEINPDIADAELDAESLRKEFEKYSNSLQRYLAIQGVTAKSLAPQVANPSYHLDCQLKAISICIRVPVRVLLGTEESKLASTQDSRTWNKRLNKRRELYLTPKVIRPFVQRLIDVGVLPKPKKIFKVEWPDLNTPTDGDKAEVASVQTEALAKYADSGLEMYVPFFEYLTLFLGKTVKEANVIVAARKKVSAENTAMATKLKLEKKYAPKPAVAPSGKATVGKKPGRTPQTKNKVTRDKGGA